MKTILVTGSNGLLGQKLIGALVGRKDMRTIATSLGPNRMLNSQGYEYESLDITSRADIARVFEKYKPHAVINTAAMTNVDACEEKKEECRQLNVQAVQNLLDAMEKQIPESQIVHLSTDFIFDGKSGPYREEDTPNPLSYYAQSKLDSEKIVEASSLKWVIARTIIVYGIVDGMSRSNIVLWAKGALEKGQKINVVYDQFRAPTLSEDLAAGCIACVEKNAKGIYHLSGPETMSVLDLVYHVADFWKLDRSLITPIASDTLNQAAKRPPHTGFIIDKAKRDLGYRPHTFVEGLKILDGQLKERALIEK
ncbi:MAG TPA: SDR family oxidoreductase [Bacteroidia bacterium]|nr:SDR family oxidoreductase [Bacteroidia bacterium]